MIHVHVKTGLTSKVLDLVRLNHFLKIWLNIFQYTDRKSPIDKHIMIMAEEVGLAHGPLMAQMFGNAGREHMKKYGTEFV